MTHQESDTEKVGGGTTGPIFGPEGLRDPRPARTLSRFDRWSGADERSYQPEEGSRDFKHAFHRLLLTSDLLALLTSTLLGSMILNMLGELPDGAWFLIILGMSPFLVFLLYLAGVYSHVEEEFDIDFVSEGARVTFVTTIWCWLLVVASALTVGSGDVLAPMLMWLFLIPGLLLGRSFARSIARRRPWYKRTLAMVGDAATINAFQQRVARHKEWGLTVGLIVVRMDGEEAWEVRHLSDDGTLAKTTELHDAGAEVLAHRVVQLATAEGIDRIVVAGGTERMSKRVELVETMLDNGVSVDDISGGPESLYARAVPQQLEGLRLLSSRPPSLRPAEVLMKRVMDIVFSLAFLVVASPVILGSAIAIKLDSTGPVFFRQPRAGLKGEVFQVCKLRTMSENADSRREELWKEGIHGEGGMLKLKDDPRVTRVGRWLRRTSIDEIPQFWNVLVGDMSLVGPRPLPLDEVARIDQKYSVRDLVRPGITGPWQVMGRSEIPMVEMLKLDYAYVNGWSLGCDIRTLLRTIPAVTGKKGVF